MLTVNLWEFGISKECRSCQGTLEVAYSSPYIPNPTKLCAYYRLKFPDTIVDVGVSLRPDGTKKYEWAVEFQCNEGPGGIVLFYAFNFYSSSNTLEHFDAMQSAFLKAGLERFLLQGAKIQLVPHKDCWYDEK